MCPIIEFKRWIQCIPFWVRKGNLYTNTYVPTFMAMCTDEMCVDMHIAVQRNKKDDKAGMGKYFLIAYLFASFVFSSSFTCYFSMGK